MYDFSDFSRIKRICRKLRAFGADEDPWGQYATDQTGRRREIYLTHHDQVILQGRDILPRMHRKRREQSH